jgi:hypothetical protein
METEISSNKVVMTHQTLLNRKQSAGTAKARMGKVATVGHFSPELSVQVKQLGLNLGGRTVQSLMGEAWNLLFTKHGLPTFAEVSISEDQQLKRPVVRTVAALEAVSNASGQMRVGGASQTVPVVPASMDEFPSAPFKPGKPFISP